MTKHQELPPSGPKREALREKGQFWTPAWVAEAMVTYVMNCRTDHVFDPAVGAGAFFAAAKLVAARSGRKICLLGTELDRAALAQARQAGLSGDDLQDVEVRDFVLDGPSRKFSSVVANPPYIRHHRISTETKQRLKLLAKKVIGKSLDGRAGYHVFFFIKALERLELGGRLAFIMPADTCEGVFAPTLWKWVLDSYRLDAVVTFSHEATPFPCVDTNAVVFMISATAPEPSFKWCVCKESSSDAFRVWVEGGMPEVQSDSISAVRRSVAEGLETGLSRPPQERHVGLTLGDFARSMRGIATGGNDFFFMTSAQMDALRIPRDYFIRAVGRTRDVEGDEITADRLRALDEAGRPTYLLSLDGRPLEGFPEALQKHLVRGEQQGLHEGALIRTRKPWYKMESRQPPAFLFAYLGRRNARFIRNTAGIVPLTGFLCVYAREPGPEFVERLSLLLNHEDTIANLRKVAKSYGSGAIKVEPRALERVPLTESALQSSGLLRIRERQFEMTF